MSRPTTGAGRVSGSIFFLAFLGGGLLFCVLVVRELGSGFGVLFSGVFVVIGCAMGYFLLVIEPGTQSARGEFTLSPTGREIILHSDARTR